MTINATAYLRKMDEGGSKAQLFECDDGNSYVVKLIGNPQGTRILSNEFIVGKIAEFIGEVSPPVAIVNVSESLVKHVNPLVGANFKPGLQIGSLYLGKRGTQVFPSNLELMKKTANLASWPAAIAIDTLTQNSDRGDRHVLITVDKDEHSRFWAIDHGHCMGVTNGWSSLRAADVSLRGIYRELVDGANPFEATYNRLGRLDKNVLEKMLEEVPSDSWEVSEQDKQNILTYVEEAVKLLPDKLLASKSAFPRWG